MYFAEIRPANIQKILAPQHLRLYFLCPDVKIPSFSSSVACGSPPPNAANRKRPDQNKVFSRIIIYFSIRPTFGTFFVRHARQTSDEMNSGKIVIYSRRGIVGRMIADMVGERGARVVCCTSTRQTVAACMHERPDLVIVLAVAPFMDGSDFIRRIRFDRRRRPVVYVVSWQHSEQTVLSLLDCGVDQYLTFPLCMSRLQRKITVETNKSDEA